MCDILTGAQAKRIIIEGSRTTGVATNEGKLFPATAVISTVAIPNFLKLIPFLGDYSERLMRIDYLNILCVLLQLKNPISNNFWLNINDARIVFNGVVETTNPTLGKILSIVILPIFRFICTKQTLDGVLTIISFTENAFQPSALYNLHSMRNGFGIGGYSGMTMLSRVQSGFYGFDALTQAPVEGLYITDSLQDHPKTS